MVDNEQLSSIRQFSFLRSLIVQFRVISALAVRFLMTRYGRGNLGFLWVIVEPMILCVGVMALWSVLKGGYEHGIQLVALIYTGYMPLTLQRHLCASGIFIMRSSKSTLIHRNISYYDNLLVRVALEFISTTAAAAMIYLFLFLFKLIGPMYSFGTVLLGWTMMACMATGMAFLYAGLSESYEVVEKFLPAVNYLILPISGCFFMVDWLPYEAQQIIQYMPLVHAFEAVRAGMFGPSIVSHFSAFYGFSFGLILISVGMILINAVRDRV